MGDVLVKWLSDSAEDVSLSLGALLVSVGCGIRFGYPIGLVVAGALLLAYGVWITLGVRP